MSDFLRNINEGAVTKTETFRKGQQIICEQPYRFEPSPLIKGEKYTCMSDSYINAYGIEVVRILDSLINESEFHVERFTKQNNK